ncbi:MAG: hypothetical protein QOI41_712 [Myxococcales bacterium]|jgi:hypothetical protein|nr:hypothetical protein [Myxococcales bacterium]
MCSRSRSFTTIQECTSGDVRRRPSQHIEQSHGVGRHICDGDCTAELALVDAAMLDAEGHSSAGNDGGGNDGGWNDGGGSPTDPTNPV